jgi:polyhydroxybutyrate depolymerase
MTGTFALPDGVRRSDASMPLQVRATVSVTGGELVTLDNKELFDQPGEYASHSMTFGDTERTYHTYIPSGYTGDAAVPVMFTFHGGGSYAIGQLAYSEFDVVAEKEGFIVVAPDYGYSALGRFTEPGIAEFTTAILDKLIADYNIDERRVYASGISMGGGASFTLAYELSDRIAGIAPVAAGFGRTQQDLPRPMPIVVMYGTHDPVASGYSQSTYDALNHFIEQNGCSDKPSVKVWTPTDDDTTGITRFAYGGGENDTEVIFYRVDQGGHTWPGKYQYASWITVGLTTQHIDGSQAIWDDLKQHQLPK